MLAIPSRTGFLANLNMIGNPALSADKQDIVVKVRITNVGTKPFGSTTPPHGVNLGAHAIDKTGRVVVNDLARGKLPRIAPGQSVSASILLPVSKVLGYQAAILPVAEGVGWFNKWGTKPLLVGPFLRCPQPDASTVCLSDKPLSGRSVFR